MDAEMHEQPAVLDALVGRRAAIADTVRGAVPDGLAGIVLVARGSSGHAATVAGHLLSTATRRPVSTIPPELPAFLQPGARWDGQLVLAYSQSGATGATVRAVGALRAAGARTIAVTNDEASPLAAVADACIGLGAGPERAVPATKTFTAQLLVSLFAAEALGFPPAADVELRRATAAVRTVLEDPEPAERAAATVVGATGLVALGAGLFQGIALEAALKVQETSGVLSSGYDVADFLHGPVAVLGPGLPVLTFSPTPSPVGQLADLLEMARRRSARPLLVAPAAGADLPVPPGLAPPLATLPAAVRAQQLAHRLALALDLDPDTPPASPRSPMPEALRQQGVLPARALGPGRRSAP